MHVVFETPRLLLREWNHDDADFLLHLNSDREVLRYTGDLPFSNLDEVHQFIESYDHYTKFGHGRWLCIEKLSGEPIGWCGLKNQGFIDLGYRFIRAKWGQGFATEAAYECLKQGFDHFNMDEIIGRVALENVNSEKVLIKLKMQFTHLGDCHGTKAKYYKLTKSQWSNVKDNLKPRYSL